MTRAKAWLTASMLTVSAFGAVLLRADTDVPARSERAVALYGEAQELYAAGQFQAAARRLRDAWAADPDQTLALAELRRLISRFLIDQPLLDSLYEIADAHHDPALGICVRAMFSDTVGRPFVPLPSTDPTTRRCDALRAMFVTQPPAVLLQHRRAAAEQYPYSAYQVGLYLDVLVEVDAAAGLRQARRAARRESLPLGRAHASVMTAFALHRLGRHSEAAERERGAQALARASGAGVEWAVQQLLRDHWVMAGDIRDGDSITAHLRAVSHHAELELRRLQPLLDRGGRAYTLFDEGSHLLGTGRLSEARTVLEHLVALSDSLADPRAQATARARYGRLLVKLGRLDEAERELLAARQLAQSANLYVELRETAHDLLHLYDARGRIADAVAAGRDFQHYSRIIGNREGVLMAHHDLGWAYRRQGMLDSAETAFLGMVAEADTIGPTYHYWAGEYYEYIGALEQAREYYRTSTLSGDRTRRLTGMARVSEALGDTAAALHFARLADRDTSAWYPEFSPVLPSLLARLGQVREATVLLRRSRTLAAGRGNGAAFARLTLELAELELNAGRMRTAGALGDTAAREAGQLGLTELALRGHVLALRANGTDTAMRRLPSVLLRADAMGIPQLSAAMHALHADALVAAGRTQDALAAYTRAADWVDKAVVRVGSDPSRASYRAVHGRVSARALGILLATDSATAFAAWSARRKGGSPDRAARVAATLPSRLPPDQAVIDFVVLDTVVAALVITDHGRSLHTLPLTADSLRARVTRLRAPLAPRLGSAVDRSRIAFDTATALRLYRDLIEPLRHEIGSRTDLTLLNDGPLHVLPFDALVMGGTGARVRYLLDTFTLTHVPSLDALAEPRARLSLARILAIYDPATDGTRDEVTAIGHVLTNALIPLAAADVPRLHELVRSAGVIHVATHAEPNDFNPDYARLALPGGRSLHARQIRGWSLRSALIVLSACETASGRLAGGEGTLSLSRAFLQAGAAGTIATHWPVGAATTELMTEFYLALRSGQEPAAALRAARIALRKNGHAHPFYWAPFTFTARGLSRSSRSSE